jgi:RimJ/RimL family protein N-acetyltransferase
MIDKEIMMIRLRPFKIGDAGYLTEWVKEERIFSMWCANKFEYPLSVEQIIEYKELYEKDELGWSFTALNDEGIPVGHLLMRKADYENQSVHLGFVVLDEKYRGKGYGKAMLRQDHNRFGVRMPRSLQPQSGRSDRLREI